MPQFVRRARVRLLGVAGGLAVCLMLVAVPQAFAGQILFARGGDIWTMKDDGTGARLLIAKTDTPTFIDEPGGPLEQVDSLSQPNVDEPTGTVLFDGYHDSNTDSNCGLRCTGVYKWVNGAVTRMSLDPFTFDDASHFESEPESLGDGRFVFNNWGCLASGYTTCTIDNEIQALDDVPGDGLNRTKLAQQVQRPVRPRRSDAEPAEPERDRLRLRDLLERLRLRDRRGRQRRRARHRQRRLQPGRAELAAGRREARRHRGGHEPGHLRVQPGREERQAPHRRGGLELHPRHAAVHRHLEDRLRRPHARGPRRRRPGRRLRLQPLHRAHDLQRLRLPRRRDEARDRRRQRDAGLDGARQLRQPRRRGGRRRRARLQGPRRREQRDRDRRSGGRPHRRRGSRHRDGERRPRHLARPRVHEAHGDEDPVRRRPVGDARRG